MRALTGLLVVVLLLASMPARARMLPPNDGSPTAACLTAAAAAGTLAGIPDGLMGRLAQVESGRPMANEGAWRPWPWTIDADGQPYVFESQAEAVAWAESAPRRGVKFLDAGCLQVNLQHHKHAFASLTEAFDLWSNARYAARYLRELYEEAGHDWSVAVGWYHSHTPQLAYDYRTRVAALGSGIIAGLPPGSLADRLRAAGVLNVPLSGGGALLVQVNRQPAGRHPARHSACEVAAALGPLMVKPPQYRECSPFHSVAGGWLLGP